MGEVIQMSPEEQKRELEEFKAYINEISFYSGIHEKYGGELKENADAITTEILGGIMGLMQDEERKPEIVGPLTEYKDKHFNKGKELIEEGGKLDALLKEYNGLMKKEEKDMTKLQEVFTYMDKAYSSFASGILMLYQPQILEIYRQLAERSEELSGVGKRIGEFVTLLKDVYKAEDLGVKVLERHKKAEQA